MASTQADISFARRIYKHQPLGVEKHQIRLLKRCGSSGHTMGYHLTTFDFESAPKYVALSYTWGGKRPTGFISIDGKEFEIRMNLLNFLRTYATDEFLWIDQICIDQSNEQERSHQVARMSEIYSQCHFVLVWLRDDSTHIPSTKQAALDFNNGLQSYTKHGYGKESSSDEKKCFGSPTLALLHNPYFDRLWIVQELLLPKSIRLLVEGNVEVSWDSLRRRHEELESEIREKLPGTSWLVKSTFLRNIFASHTPVSVTYYVTLNVSKFCDRKCEDRRDKVYGLMALVKPPNKVEVDYAKSVQQVYLDTIMSMIKEYLRMAFDIYDNGFEIHKVRWPIEDNIKASRDLAQALGFTDRQTSGARSFADCVWERVRRYEVTAKLFDLEIDAETHCIISVGFEPGTYQLAKHRQLVPAQDRWWYEFEGEKYYHDCKEWSGISKLQEYTTSRNGIRLYGPYL
jgi:hypothetical protein